MNEQGTACIDELFRKKGEIQKQLLEVEQQIKEHIENEYQGKLKTALELLNEIYDNIPQSKKAYIETYCIGCGELVSIDLTDALDKIEYVFDKLIKQKEF